MKRVFTLLLTVCMLASLALTPAMAYSPAGRKLWPSEWHAALNLPFNFQDTSAAPLRSLQYSQPTYSSAYAEGFSANVADQTRFLGYIELTNSAALENTNAVVKNILSASPKSADEGGLDDHGFVTDSGSTIDIGLRLPAMAKVNSDYFTLDSAGEFTGIQSTEKADIRRVGRDFGLVFHVLTLGDYMENGTKKTYSGKDQDGNPAELAYNTEYYFSLVRYDNAVKGTNAAIIFCSGDVGTSTSWEDWSKVVREVHFFNMDFASTADFTRFTLKTDFNAPVGEKMVTLYIDGIETAKFSAPGYSKQTATAGDSVEITLGHFGYSDAFVTLTTEDPVALENIIAALKAETDALAAQVTAAATKEAIAERNARLQELAAELPALEQAVEDAEENVAYRQQIIDEKIAAGGTPTKKQEKDLENAQADLQDAQAAYNENIAETNELNTYLDDLQKKYINKLDEYEQQNARLKSVQDARKAELQSNLVVMKVHLDQVSIYGAALTPRDGTMSTFVEQAPIYTEDYVKALEAARAIDPTPYSKKSYKVISDALSEAEKLPLPENMNNQNVTQAQLDEITYTINSGIENLKFNDFNSHFIEERLMVPYSFFNDTDSGSNPINPVGYRYAWTNATILFSDPNYDIANYTINGTNTLSSFTSVVFEKTEVEGQYKVTAVYLAGTPMQNRTINKAPEGGFIIYNHTNTISDPQKSDSRYASQFFGDSNSEIISKFKVGMVAELENITLHSDKAADLITSGVWRSRYDEGYPDITKTASGDLCDSILEKYPYNGEVQWRDQFQDFETKSAVLLKVPVGAYLDEYEAIMGKIDAAEGAKDKTVFYSEESWKALQDVLATVNMDAEGLNQDMIDDWTDKLTAAYEALVEIEDPAKAGDDADNAGSSENTGDTKAVLISLSVISLLAVACACVLIIGRRRGNF